MDDQTTMTLEEVLLRAAGCDNIDLVFMLGYLAQRLANVEMLLSVICGVVQGSESIEEDRRSMTGRSIGKFLSNDNIAQEALTKYLEVRDLKNDQHPAG